MQLEPVLAGAAMLSADPIYLRTPIWIPEQLTRVLLSAQDTHGRFALLEQIAPYGAASPCHVHHKEDELIYVLDGTLSVYLDGLRRTLRGGTAVMLPRRREHAFVVESAEARLLTVFSPAGFEQLIVEAAEPVAWPVRPLGVENTLAVERMVVAAAHYACDITGPPPRPYAST